MNYHQGRNSGPNLDGGEEIRGPVNFVHPWVICDPSWPLFIFGTSAAFLALKMCQVRDI